MRRCSSTRWVAIVLAISVIATTVITATPARAQDESPQPVARAQLTPAGAVTVGQPVTVVVEVLVPTFFRGAPRFPDLDVADALVIFNDRGRNLSERRGGRTWAGQSRSYTIYPQRPGAYEIPRIDVEVTYSAGGANVATVTVSPDLVRFEADLPAAAAGLDYFIATSRLTLEETIEAPEPVSAEVTDTTAPREGTESAESPGSTESSAIGAGVPDTEHEAEPAIRTLRVGDSLTRAITVTVQDALSMVVPPLDLGSPEGLATYPAQPVVTDTGGERGERIVGTRVESTTFVAESEGRYQLPAVELAWWDVGAEELRRAGVEAITIEVIANPELVNELGVPADDESALADEEEPGGRISLVEIGRRYGLPLLAVLLVLVVIDRIARRYGIDIEKLLRGDPEAREEERLFRTFRDAARANRAADTTRAFMRWLDRWNRRPGTYAEFSAAAGDAQMDREARGVGANVYGRPTDQPASWSGSTLADRVEQARREANEKGEAAPTGTALPPLNP